MTSTGEKIPPGDMEMAMTMDPLIDQAMVVGEGRPGLAALLALSPGPWGVLAQGLGLDPDDPRALEDAAAKATVLARVAERLAEFPRHARVRALRLTLAPWTVENGLITPTLKVKRPEIESRFAAVIESLYP